MSPTPQTQGPVSSADLEALAEQLGRVPRGVVAIAARCVCGRPTVVRTAPRLDDGTPFPTSYYLTHPAAVKGCSTLEAEHLMETFNADLAAGAGVNPIGDRTLEALRERGLWDPERCSC